MFRQFIGVLAAAVFCVSYLHASDDIENNNLVPPEKSPSAYFEQDISSNCQSESRQNETNDTPAKTAPLMTNSDANNDKNNAYTARADDEVVIADVIVEDKTKVERNSSVCLRGAAFFPANKRFRRYVGQVVPDYQVELSTKISQRFEAWFNFDWLCKRKSMGAGWARVKMPTLSIGIKFVQPITRRIDLYLGIGPAYGRVSVTNWGFHEKKKKSKHSYGGVAKLGVRLGITEAIFLDVFGDYFADWCHDGGHNVNLTGLKTGVGLGFRF